MRLVFDTGNRVWTIKGEPGRLDSIYAADMSGAGFIYKAPAQAEVFPNNWCFDSMYSVWRELIVSMRYISDVDLTLFESFYPEGRKAFREGACSKAIVDNEALAKAKDDEILELIDRIVELRKEKDAYEVKADAYAILLKELEDK